MADKPRYRVTAHGWIRSAKKRWPLIESHPPMEWKWSHGCLVGRATAFVRSYFVQVSP